jgi:hypothetical protein
MTVSNAGCPAKITLGRGKSRRKINKRTGVVAIRPEYQDHHLYY